jgi:ferrous iron transport protein A
MSTQTLPLTMATIGARLKITELLGGWCLRRKATEMGLHAGAEIEVRQHERGAVIVCSGQARYAIGAGLAHKIIVELL